MLSNTTFMLVICLAAFPVATALRVDWNTNKGPIMTATPRVTIIPRPPYREPAPVWEDQSDDIPNPNPYKYVLPPPSRPHLTKLSDGTQLTYTNFKYGQLFLPQKINTKQNKIPQWIASLTAQNIPNLGYRYIAHIPNGYNDELFILEKPEPHTSEKRTPYWTPYNIGPKLQGKYNIKTKKYKAYEKLKSISHVQ